MSDDDKKSGHGDIGGSQSVSAASPKAPQRRVESTQLHGQTPAAGADDELREPSGPGPGSAV